jgi:hypothetical protein
VVDVTRRPLGTGGTTSTTCTFVLSTEELAAIDFAARLRGLSRSCFIRTMLRPLTVVKGSPAEAARDVETVETAPPSAPVAASRVASAGDVKAHPWRRQSAAMKKRPAALRSRS